MNTKQNRLLTGIGRLVLSAFLCISVSLASSKGQSLIESTPLEVNDVPYLKDQSPSLTMHNWTSSSVVAIRRHADILNRYTPLRGTAFFIITDPRLDHYCLLTAAHVLNNADETWSLTNELTDIDFNFRTTFNNAAGSRTNPTQYTTLASRPISVTVAGAAYKRNFVVAGSLDWQDYAIIKVPKEGMIGVAFMQHAVQFLSDIPTTRLNADAYKSIYVVHHGNLRPQQISTRTAEQFQKGSWLYPHQFSAINFPGLYPGSSGSPLVLPVGTGGVLGAAIGIYTGYNNNATPGEHVFQKLTDINSALLTHCLGNLKKEEWEKGKVIVPLSEKARKALVNTCSAVNTAFSELRAGLNSCIGRINTGATVQPTAVIATVETCMRYGTSLSADLNANKSDDIIKADIEKFVFQSTVLTQQLERLTLEDRNPNFALQDTKQTLLDAIGSMGKFAYFNSKPQANDYNFAIKKIIEVLGPIAFQLISSEVSAFTNTMLYYAGGYDLANNRAKRDVSLEPTIMQAPDELDMLHTRVIQVANTMGDLLHYYGKADPKYVDFYRGLAYYYQDLPKRSDRYLLYEYYRDEYELVNLIQKAIQTDLATFLRNVPKPYAKDVQQCYDRLTKDNSQLSVALTALKGKDYPHSFLTIKKNTPFAYANLFYNADRLSDFPVPVGIPQLSYSDLISVDLNNIQDEPMYNQGAIGKVSVDGKETVEHPTGIDIYKTPKLSWYTTRFKVRGSFSLYQIEHVYHPYFEAYMKANQTYPSRSGRLFYDVNQLSPISFTNTFNLAKVPANQSLISGDQFNFNTYTETQLLPAPEYSANPGSTDRIVQFEVSSPSILLYLKSYQAVREVWYTGPYLRTILHNDTGPFPSTGNPSLSDNLMALQSWAKSNIGLNYKVNFNDKLYWDFSFPIALPVEEEQLYTIKSRQNLKYLTADGTGLNQLNPPLNINYYWKFVLNADGSYCIKSASSGLFIDINGASTADGTDLILYKPTYANNQKWMINASQNAPGWTIFSSLMPVTPSKRITSKNSILRAFSYAANNQLDQDWLIEPVKPNGARVTSQFAQVKRVEEGILPTLQPNPATDQVQLNLPSGYEQSEISISTINGANLTLPIQIQQNKWLIDVRQLPTGMYLLRVQSKNKPQRVLKFMKK
ncbi:RICIN domain-containing protein [Larkinella humicola]|nr:RICIN domain-containing protein [Larkinella humicola]